MPVINYMTSSLVTVIILLSIYIGFTVPSLRSDLKESQKVVVEHETAILFQNAEVESERVDKQKAINKLKEWESLPAEIKWKDRIEIIYKDVNITKYKTIYKDRNIYIDRNITREVSCEDNKIIEHNIYSADWNNF